MGVVGGGEVGSREGWVWGGVEEDAERGCYIRVVRRENCDVQGWGTGIREVRKNFVDLVEGT